MNENFGNLYSLSNPFTEYKERDNFNPFNFTKEELTTTKLQPFTYIGHRKENSRFKPDYSIYNPYPDIREFEMLKNKGVEVSSFFDRKNQYKPPEFENQPVSDLLAKMNIEKLRNSFEREDRTKEQIKTIFNPRIGNTAEERAKNEKINKLLSEIQNFAIQYNLSNRQKEQLEMQVLSNHLPEYIQTLDNIKKQDLQTKRDKKIRTAGGDVINEDNLFDDPNMRDEEEKKQDLEEEETENLEEEEVDIPEEEQRQELLPTTASGSGPQEIESAVSSLDDTRRLGGDIIKELKENSSKEPYKKLLKKFRTNKLSTLLSDIVSPRRDERPIIKEYQDYINISIGLGTGTNFTLDEEEKRNDIIKYVKENI